MVLAENAQDPDLSPFCGPVHLGRSLLVVPAHQQPRLGFFTPMEREEAAATGLALLTPEALDLRRWVRDFPDPGRRLAAAVGQALLLSGVAPGRIALAGHLGVGEGVEACQALAKDGFDFVSAHSMLKLFRKAKTEQQLVGIQAAARGTLEAFRRVAELLASAQQGGDCGKELWQGASPLTVSRLKGEVAQVLARHGLEQPAGNIIAPGEEGSVPHNSGTGDRRLRAGESLIVDLFPKGQLFADCTRTFCVGIPPEALAKAHGAVLEALQAAARGLRLGLPAWELQRTTCELFVARGYEAGEGTTTGYVHGLGHGVGFELHEFPSFRESCPPREGILEAGDVLTLEPGLYDPAAGLGVRLEDLWSLGTDRFDCLTPLPYELDPQRWLAHQLP